MANQLQEIIDALQEIVGDNYVLTQPEDLAVYECDAETLDTALPDLVVLPGSTDEVAAVVALAKKHNLPVVPRGAGTGLSGGSTPVAGGISLALTRMTRIIEIDSFEGIAIVEAGVTNLSVSQAAKEFGLYFAPDPSSQVASTIGGNIAENAGGPHCLKYGMTTAHVLGARVVLEDGSIVTLGSRSRACLDLDLLGVFVGSEGTIGVVTEAVLKL
ncbi:MAG: FAD-binding oxidoreductase, partial [Candidatus Obscuribacterales bacterium]|nr:FAD-binding oxidoreductase [Candidatus Obscuribacterales bacterium]